MQQPQEHSIFPSSSSSTVAHNDGASSSGGLDGHTAININASDDESSWDDDDDEVLREFYYRGLTPPSADETTPLHLNQHSHEVPLPFRFLLFISGISLRSLEPGKENRSLDGSEEGGGVGWRVANYLWTALHFGALTFVSLVVVADAYECWGALMFLCAVALAIPPPALLLSLSHGLHHRDGSTTALLLLATNLPPLPLPRAHSRRLLTYGPLCIILLAFALACTLDLPFAFAFNPSQIHA